MAVRPCDFCGEPVGEDPVERGNRVYCSESCAFEAARSSDCTGRTDSVMAESNVEPAE